MGDLKNPRLMYLKAVLFLVIGVLSSALLVLERPTLRVVMLLAVAVWAFARSYYFAFYVIERYIDPAYRFSGLTSLVAYLVRRERSGPQSRNFEVRK